MIFFGIGRRRISSFKDHDPRATTNRLLCASIIIFNFKIQLFRRGRKRPKLSREQKKFKPNEISLPDAPVCNNCTVFK